MVWQSDGPAAREDAHVAVGAGAGTNAPPSSTSSHSTARGESSGAWKPGPVGGVEGLDADGAGPVCRVKWGLCIRLEVRCVPAVSTPAGIPPGRAGGLAAARG